MWGIKEKERIVKRNRIFAIGFILYDFDEAKYFDHYNLKFILTGGNLRLCSLLISIIFT
jgi:hypothetical protein